MAQSNSSASGRQGGIRGFLANNGNRTGNRITSGLDRANVIPGMDERGNFSWEEFRSDIGRTAANMVFPGLGSLIGLGRNNGWGLGSIGGAIGGTAGAVGRLFDGNPNTGFWNYGAAPWNMSPDGSPNFMGPPSNLAGSGNSPSPHTGPLGPVTDQGPQQQGPSLDPNFGLGWVGEATTPAPTPMDRNTPGFGQSADGRTFFQGNNRQITNLAGQMFNRSTPSHWRRAGTSGSWETGGGLSNPWAMGDFSGSSGVVQSMYGIVK
jgi:hypothetical protein